jgi:thermitase
MHTRLHLALLLFYFTTSVCVDLSAQGIQRIMVRMHTASGVAAGISAEVYQSQLQHILPEATFNQIEVIYTGKNRVQNEFVVLLNPATDRESILQSLHQSPLIALAEPDHQGSGAGMAGGIVPNDAFYRRQWGLHNDGTFTLSPSKAGADINMQRAWELTQGSEEIIVAVMDSGLALDHPEFAGRLWSNAFEIPGNGIDDDQNGLIDDVLGWNFVNNTSNPSDDQGHGTNVTSILAATGNNMIGYAGVDWNCKIMVLKGLNENNSGFYSWWISAIRYAADHGARVINLSVGGSSFSTFLRDAIQYALDLDVVVVACMMNTNSSTVFYPAAFPGVIAVGSTNPDDSRSAPFFWSPTSGSNFGPHISVVAPGNFMYGLDFRNPNNYNSYWGGTSQATPLVAGLASLLLAQDPFRLPADIKNIIESTAVDQVGRPSEDTPGWDIYHGFGRVNAFAALSQLSTSIEQDRPPIAHKWSFWPNPLQSNAVPSVAELYIKSDLNIKNSRVLLLNALGQVLYFEPLQVPLHHFQFDRLSPGIYLLGLQWENGNADWKKLMVE